MYTICNLLVYVNSILNVDRFITLQYRIEFKLSNKCCIYILFLIKYIAVN